MDTEPTASFGKRCGLNTFIVCVYEFFQYYKRKRIVLPVVKKEFKEFKRNFSYFVQLLLCFEILQNFAEWDLWATKVE